MPPEGILTVAMMRRLLTTSLWFSGSVGSTKFNMIAAGTSIVPFIFIGPESDHWLCLSLTNWLTNWLTNSCLVNLIDVSLACEDGNSKLVEVVDDEKQFTRQRLVCSFLKLWRAFLDWNQIVKNGYHLLSPGKLREFWHHPASFQRLVLLVSRNLSWQYYFAW